MKNTVFILMGILICSCKEDQSKPIPDNEKNSVSQIVISKQSDAVRIKNGSVFLNEKKYDGFLYELYPDGKDTLAIESYSGGVLHGISKKWYPNCQLMEVRCYSQGRKNGKQISYWWNGKKKFEFTAANDQYEGELKEWNNEGSLIHLATYENGQEEGTQKLWYDNGKIRANYVMIKGKRYGLLGTKNCRNVSDSIFTVK
jgi:antitoxin component YwqK of YwqJK toxin-antitoxin module